MKYIDLSGYKIPREDFLNLSLMERHNLMMSLNNLEDPGDSQSQHHYISDYEMLKQKYNFIHDASKEKNSVLQNYYNSICKKYVVCDLSKYKTGMIGLRWRTKREIEKGQGHFTCASIGCSQTKLNNYEFRFRYIEEGIQKETLVKVRVCKDCAYKLHYRQINAYLEQKKKNKTDEQIREEWEKMEEIEFCHENVEDSDYDESSVSSSSSSSSHYGSVKKRNKRKKSSCSSNSSSRNLSSENANPLKKKRKIARKERLQIQQILEENMFKEKDEKNQENALFYDLLL